MDLQKRDSKNLIIQFQKYKSICRFQMVNEVEKDIRNFIKQQKELLFNEFDLQMQLAIYLRNTGKYDDVESEYFLPTKNTDILKGYEWDSNLRIDLVVLKEKEYLPIELKYVTKKVVRDYERFGVIIKNMEILKNQSAQDIRRYDFWKDVRRIELIKNIFPAVKNGIAVFLTNDSSYTRDPNINSTCYPFSMSSHNIIGGGIMDWNGNPATGKDHKAFKLDGIYKLNWEKTNIDEIEYEYTILKI